MMNNKYDLNILWNKIIPNLEKSLNRPIYEALISSTKPLSLNTNTFEIAVPNEVVKDWLSKHCVTLLEQELRTHFPEITSVNFVVGPEDLFTTPLLEKSSFSSEKALMKQTVGWRSPSSA